MTARGNDRGTSFPVRRVITGETTDGKSVFSHVEEVEPAPLGGGVLRYVVWGWPEIPGLPYHNPGPAAMGTRLPETPGEVQIETWVLPPGFPLPGSHEDASRMHSTDTVDIIFVLEGEISLRQADDGEVTLRRGDVLVQNGAVHTWRNPIDEPCVLSFVFFGTTRGSESRPG